MTSAADDSTTRVETVAAAAQRWRRELADLGGRNTLLWYRDLPRGTFDLTIAHPTGVAKLLAGQRTRLSELVRDDVALTQARASVGAILDKTHELHTEHGVSTCFVAVGMATWRLRRATTAPRAPVLLRGAQIAPTDVTHQDFVLQLDQRTVFNPVLEHYLRGELGIDLDATDLAARAAADGFDPRETYRALEEVCADVDGFGINPQTVIATFGWAKLDLVAHMSTDPAVLAGHPLIAALTGHAESLPEQLPSQTTHDPRRELSVLDADGPQRAVIDAVQQGVSLVLDTPAGTGATQTVANVLAARLAQGRTALVVSEERSALQALRSRLSTAGLDGVLLDLAEDPAGAARTLNDLITQLDDSRSVNESALPGDPLPRWTAARGVLVEHERCMHQVHEPWGQSLSQAQSALAALGQLPRPPLSRVRLRPTVVRALTPERVAQMTRMLTDAAEREVWQRGRVEDPWYGAVLPSDQDADRAADLIEALAAGGLAEAREEITVVCREAGLPEPLNLSQWRQRLDLLSQVHVTTDHFRLQVYDAPLPELIVAVTGRTTPRSARPGVWSRRRSRRTIRTLLRPGKPPVEMAGLLASAHRERTEWEKLAGKGARPHLPHHWQTAVRTFERLGPDMEWLATVLVGTASGTELFRTHLDLLTERLVRLDARRDRVHAAATAYPLLQPLREAGLAELVDDVARRGISPAHVPAEVEFVYQASLLDVIHAQQEEMPTAQDVAAAAADFRLADREHVRANAVRVRRALTRRLNRAVEAHPRQVRALREAVEAGSSLRAVLTRCPDIVMALRPVLVGSPLVVPATLPPGLRVELVVVEHAGRTTTARSIAALARGAQAMIVGDGNRYGPNYFSYTDQRLDPLETHCTLGDSSARTVAGGGPEVEEQPRSLLQDASSVLPVSGFTTHYRSLDHRLVRPLDIIVPGGVDAFPGVWPGPRANVRVVADPDDVASTAVATAVDHVARQSTRSVMVLSDSEEMARSVRVGLRASATGDECLAAVLAGDEAGGLRVGTVTRWSGEIADRVIWARDPRHVPLSQDVVTVLAAARGSVTVITVEEQGADGVVRASTNSFAPRDAHGKSVCDGAQMLTLLLDPLKGARSTLANVASSPHPLLDDIVARLTTEGFTVHRDVGLGRHALALGIEDPHRPGRFLVGVDLDTEPLPEELGRDHCRLRPEQLSRLGWTTTTVLSASVFRDPGREVAALIDLVHQASHDTRASQS